MGCARRCARRGSRRHGRRRRWNAGLGVVGLDHGFGDVGGRHRPQDIAVLLAGIENEAEALLLSKGDHDLANFVGDLVERLLAILLLAALQVLGRALQLLGLVVDGAHFGFAVDVTDGGGTVLELLFEGFDFLVLRLQLGFLRLVLLTQIGDVALEFIGLSHSTLELDDGNLCGCGGGGGGGSRIRVGRGGLSKGCNAHSGREQANE